MKQQAKTYTDSALVTDICGTEEQRAQALAHIYMYSGWRETALASLLHAGAPMQDAKDAIQESLLTLDRHVRSGKYDKERSLKNYFIGICHGHFFGQKRKGWRTDYVDDLGKLSNAEPVENPEALHLKEEATQLMQQIISRLDERCQNLLTRYMFSFSMKEIRDEFNIVSDDMTRKLAMNCRKKLFQLFEANPTFKNYFNQKQ